MRATAGATPLWPSAQSAWDKITAALGAAGSSTAAKWQQVVAVREARPARAEAAAAVEQAVRERRVLHLRYAAADGAVTERDVEPAGLLTAGGGWYLIGWCRLRRADRGFRLDRIRDATVLDGVVEPRDFHAALRAAGVPLAAGQERRATR